MAISELPAAPASTDSRATFSSKMFDWIAALATFRTEANAQAAATNAIAAGTAVGIPYTFSATTTDADPGAGYLRLDSATQNLATTIRADLVGSDGTTYTDVLATLDDSTSTVKGQITLQKIADPTKWITFTVSALASPSGYKNLTVAVVAASEASPFTNGDSVILKFTRTGDKGATGAPSGAIVLLSTVTASASATMDVETTFDGTYDVYELVVSGLIVASAGALNLRMKTAGAYVTSASYAYHASKLAVGSAAYAANVSTGAAQVLLFDDAGGSGGCDLTIRIHNPASTSLQKSLYWRGHAFDSTSARLQALSGAGHNSFTTALTGIRIFSAAGNITSGTARLYGINNS